MTQKRKLKILQVLSHKNMERGGAIQGYLLALGLKQMGHSVKMVFNRGKELESNDLKTIRGVEENGIDYEFFKMDSWLDALKFRKTIQEENYDVIHTHRDIALRFVLRASVGMKLNSLYTNRGNNYRLKKREQKIYFSKKLDCTCAVAKAVKDVLVERCGMDSRKVEVVYGSFDEKRFNPEISGRKVRKEWGIGKEEKIIGNIAAHQGKKGHLFYFEAIKKVVEKRPDVKFLLVGARLEEKFGETVRETGIDKNVIFAGFRSDIPDVISAFDVSVCSATKGEGLTGAVRESLAMAKPVVSTNVAGNGEVVIHGKTGMLVPPKDNAAMAEAIIYLLENSEEALKMAQAGRELVLEKCNNEARCRRVEELYYNVLSSKNLI